MTRRQSPQDVERLRAQAIAVNTAMMGVSARILEVTVPVFALGTSRKVELAGTGVLLSVADAHFLITAAHVANWRHERNLAIPLAGTVRRLQGDVAKAFTTGVESGADQDRIDTAVIRLNPKLAELATPSTFLRRTELGVLPREIGSAGLVVSGYRSSAQKRTHRSGHIESFLDFIVAKEAAPTFYERVRGSPDTNLVLSYDDRRLWSPRGLGTSPSLRGMSGSGLWLVRGPVTAPTGPPTLVGIFTEWHKGTNKYLLATRIEVALVIIGDQYPELRASLAVSGAA